MKPTVSKSQNCFGQHLQGFHAVVSNVSESVMRRGSLSVSHSLISLIGYETETEAWILRPGEGMA
jgi:hypothetical protein